MIHNDKITQENDSEKRNEREEILMISVGKTCETLLLANSSSKRDPCQWLDLNQNRKIQMIYNLSYVSQKEKKIKEIRKNME